MRGDKETRFDRCFKLIKLLGTSNSTLIYFQEKVDLVRFCKHAQDHLERVEDVNLDRLVQYVSARLGANSPLVTGLPYGVAFHHGDLPVDIRNEIERAYRDQVIRVLACTTTLAEGVNLPIRTLILGYYQTSSGHRLSVADFKNIAGRAGRALVETEGKIIAIRHPWLSSNKEDKAYFDSLISLDESKLVIKSEFMPRTDSSAQEHILAELNQLAQTIQDAQTLAQVEYLEKWADILQRLQVFIFTLYEDKIIESSIESVENALQTTLLYTLDCDPRVRQAVNKLSQRFVAICSRMDSERLRRFNTSGLRYQSNLVLEQLIEQIANQCAELAPKEYSFEKVITSEVLELIYSKIREAGPRSSEYRKNQYKVIDNLDHHRVLIDWIEGTSFSEIRDRYFGELRDPGIRTETCQSYISKQFTFKLPWILAALHTHIGRIKNQTMSLWLESAPAQVKYGVNTPEAVYFSSIGVRSRFLARTLGDLYRNEKGALSSASWQSLGDWFRGLSPFDLRDRAPNLPDLAIGQAVRRANVIRPPSRELQRRGRLLFNIAGWQYYDGEKFIDEIISQTWEEQKPYVQLLHEPQNEYDEYAVSVHWGQPSENSRLGYVPRSYNEEIATLLVLGRELVARIMTVGSPRPDRWRPVQVWVELNVESEVTW